MMRQLSRLNPALQEEVGESVIRKMNRIAREMGAVNLSQGFPDWLPPLEVREAAVAAIRDEGNKGHNQYTIPFGDEELRKLIAEKSARSGIMANPQTQITVTSGATEGIFATLLTLGTPGLARG